MRIRFIMNKPLQMRFLLLILASMLSPLLILGGCLYYLIFTLLADQLGIPESIAINLFPVIHKINIILMVVMPPVLVLVFLWGVLLSHTFIGPLERLEKEMGRIAESGDCAKRLRVRRKDAIRPIADAINRLLDVISAKR